MTDLELEFEQLKVSRQKAEEYFNGPYKSDSDEIRKKADAKFNKIKDRMDDIWQQIGKMVLDMDSKMSVDKWMEQVGKQEYLIPKSVEFYSRSNKVIIKLERPQFWKDPITKVMNL